MRFHYISPSTLPSLSANSVHVALQCDAIGREGVDVVLYAKRSVPEPAALASAVGQAYGVKSARLKIVSYYSPSTKGDNLRIAAMAVLGVLRDRRPKHVLSRNLYAAFLLACLFRLPLIFETHQLETGLRKWMQRLVMRCRRVTTIVISSRLEQYLTEHHGVPPRNCVVMHDAAPDGIEPISSNSRRTQLMQLVPLADGRWRQVCGYFGHLYQGRGIEIVEAMADARPDCLFLVYGGNPEEVSAKKLANNSSNLVFMGHVYHPEARKLMCLMDVLLMPYQESVSIGVSGHDTARWMSPMKMFEYMGSGVPIISSDLPVLREVLCDGENCRLALPTDVSGWVTALDQLYSEAGLSDRLGRAAHTQYLDKHTWRARARGILVAARCLA